MRYALLVLLLAGCASPEQIAARRAAEAEQERQQAVAYRQSLESQCAAVGYSYGTDQFRGCVLQLHATEQQRRAAIAGALIQGAAIQQATQPRPSYQPPRTPVQTNCQRDYFGNVRCTTY